MSYRGRFAPSPTGPLHFGSLIAAVASYCDAKAANGKWLLRIDDIDPLREIPGAATSILLCLEQHGLVWDEPVLYQSTRTDAYHAALESLWQQQLLFYCTCSRSKLTAFGSSYSGFCRHTRVQPSETFSIRIHVPDKQICVEDVLQGRYCQNLIEAAGDFVLMRKEGYFAYHLACMLDEAFLGITHVVRGVDLLESTPKQVYLAQQLNLPIPQYAHIPVLLSDDGVKLSKQTGATAIQPENASISLLNALGYLRQPITDALVYEKPETILAYAVKNWSMASVPNGSSFTRV